MKTGTEALLILARGDEGIDHRTLNRRVTHREAVHDLQPEDKPTYVRVTSQVASVLRVYERVVVFGTHATKRFIWCPFDL